MLKLHFNFRHFLTLLAIVSFFVGASLIFTCNSYAAYGVPRTINFQGRLVTNPGGVNVANGTVSIVFSLYNGATGGTAATALWSETQTVTVTDGIFRVALGSVTPIPANFNFNWDGLYLGVNVNGNGEMNPRIQMASVPFAFNALRVAGLTVQDTSGNASTSGTLQVANGVTVKLPVSGTGLIYADTGSTGNLSTFTNSTTQTGSIVGLNLTLSGAASNYNQYGLQFNLSGPTSGNQYDILGSGSTWYVTNVGALHVASCVGCGSGGTNYWNLVSGANGGYITPINSTADLLIGGQSTASAKFAILNLNSGTPIATIAGNLIVMPYTNGVNELGGNVGIGFINPLATLSVAGTGLFQTPVASSAAFQVQNSAGAPVFLVDTTNNTNLLTNPGFEIGLTGWSTRGTSVISKNTSTKYIYNGQASLWISTSTANSGAKTTAFVGGGALGAGTYTLSFYAMLSSGTLTTLNAGYNNGSDVPCTLNSNMVKTSGFQRYSCSFTATSINNIYIDDGAGATAINLFIDAVQLEQNGFATPYTIGAIQLRGLINSPVSIRPFADSTSVFQIQNANGNNNLFIADSLDNAIGIGTNTPLATLDLRGLSGTTPVASISGKTSFASLVANNDGVGDLFTASASGWTRFTISNTGAITALGTANISGLITDTTGIALGTTPAAAGVLRLPNATYITARNQANGADVNMIEVDTSSTITFGANLSGLTSNGAIAANGGITFDQSTDTLGAHTLGGDITGNSKNITALAGLTINAAGAINSAGAGALNIGTATTTSLVMGNSSVTGMTFNVATGGNFVLQKNGAGLSCAGNANGGKLTTDSSGNVTCQDENGTNYFAQSNGLTYLVNPTTDFAIGGNSTASADFVFGAGINGGGAIATFSGTLMMGAQPDSSVFDQTNWKQISGTAGTLGGGTANIASISAMVAYNGSLYAGTYNPTGGGAAEVYRYNNGTSWTLVSQSGGTGQIMSGGTSGIASVSAMTVFNGYLYVGTSKMNAAEVYRYNGGTSWSLISSTTPGTFGTVTLQDGVSAMGVYLGQLYIGTREASGGGGARLMRWEGGPTWTSLNATGGTFVTTYTVGVQAVTSIATINGALYFGIYSPKGDADVLKWTGAATFLALDAADAAGTYSVNGASVAGFTQSIVTVFNGNLIVGLSKGSAAEVVAANQDIGETGINTFTRLNNTSGQMVNLGTSSIDYISAMTVYNGFLYVGTGKRGNAEVYRYTAGDQKFFKLTQSTAGQIAAGGTSGIDAVTMFAPLNGDLYAGTQKLVGATGNLGEVYKLANVNIDKSYSIVFHALPSLAGGEQNSNANTASIFYLASASANLGNSAGNSGAFIFDHAIQTRNGSYDVAEDYPTRDDSLRPGDLVAIDPNERGFVKKTSTAYDYTVLGVFSTNPALRLSQEDSSINGGYIVPVALAGRVPVKVSTESGEIKPGDYLTSSSTPGVAMKATKSGGVFAQAMEGYAGDGVGEILVYIKSMTYNGSIADSFANLDTNVPNFAANVLASIKSQGTGVGQSSVVTDRLIAGLEVITPKISATQVSLDNMTALSGSDIALNLSDDGKFVIKNSSSSGLITFDSNGNAYFSGLVVADRIKANQIIGLDIFANRISALEANTAVLADATGSAELATASASLPPAPTLTSLTVDGLATVSADLNVKGNGFIQGALDVLDNITTNNLLVSGFAYFISDVVFKGNVRFESPPIFNNDTAGFAVVKQGSDNVVVTFSQEYVDPPVVTASIALDKVGDNVLQKQLEDAILNGNTAYVITQRTTKGFVIRLNKPAPEDITFSWVALSVQDIKTSGQDLNATPSPVATDSAAFQSILNQLNNSPTPPPPE